MVARSVSRARTGGQIRVPWSDSHDGLAVSRPAFFVTLRSTESMRIVFGRSNTHLPGLGKAPGAQTIPSPGLGLGVSGPASTSIRLGSAAGVHLAPAAAGVSSQPL